MGRMLGEVEEARRGRIFISRIMLTGGKKKLFVDILVKYISLLSLYRKRVNNNKNLYNNPRFQLLQIISFIFFFFFIIIKINYN